MVRTWVRNTDWQDDLSSARAMVSAAPASYKGHTALAAALYDSHAAIDSVIAEAEKSLAPLEHLPALQNFAPPYQQAGFYYLSKGDALLTRDAQGRMVTPVEARQAYQKALQALERCDSIVQANNAHENAEGTQARGGPAIQPLRYADLYRLLSEVELRLGDVAARAGSSPITRWICRHSPRRCIWNWPMCWCTRAGRKRAWSR